MNAIATYTLRLIYCIQGKWDCLRRMRIKAMQIRHKAAFFALVTGLKCWERFNNKPSHLSNKHHEMADGGFAFFVIPECLIFSRDRSCVTTTRHAMAALSPERR